LGRVLATVPESFRKKADDPFFSKE
jgi:hypothetical protein